MAVDSRTSGVVRRYTMSTPGDAVAALRDLEESLWREETLYDRAYMGGVLAPGFLEFGMSGRRYDREAVIEAEIQPIGARLPLEDFIVEFVRPDVALVTYVSEDEADGPRRANRMSLWDRSGGRWQLLFHQGTAVPAGGFGDSTVAGIPPRAAHLGATGITASPGIWWCVGCWS